MNQNLENQKSYKSCKEYITSENEYELYKKGLHETNPVISFQIKLNDIMFLNLCARKWIEDNFESMIPVCDKIDNSIEEAIETLYENEISLIEVENLTYKHL